MSVLQLLRTCSWQELRHHPWRHGAAVLAVMLGVTLAFSVHLINASALSEFAQAARTVGGQSDLEVRAPQGRMDENLYPLIAQAPAVAAASPVLELATHALVDGQKINLRVLGMDALRLVHTTPALMPQPDTRDDRFALFAPAQVFLNASARQRLGSGTVRLQSGSQLLEVRVAGSIAGGGPPLAVMDLGAAQDLFGPGLSRVDVRLQPGSDRSQALAQWQASGPWPAQLLVAEPADAASRVSQLSRAYRVNLTVLALVALFTGAFLVFSVLWLSVAKRAPQLALLGVLGLSGGERLRWVLAESLILGLAGSILGIALGTGLAALGLQLLGGDLGGGYFPGTEPRLQWSAAPALAYGALGVLAAGVGGWWPARAAQTLPPAQTLKGLGLASGGQRHLGWALGLLVTSAVLAALPPIGGMALAAYAAVALMLFGGIAALPGLIELLYPAGKRLLGQRLLPLLAIERAGRVRESASVAVSGVVAALSLAVALTVMVSSFRLSVTQWLGSVLPADLYLRSSASAAAADTIYFEPALINAMRQLPGVARIDTLRVTQLGLDPALPPISLIARDLSEPRLSLPLIGEPLPTPPGQMAVYVSEAVVELYGARVGEPFERLNTALSAGAAQAPRFFVAGIWRDYARQFGAVMIDQRDHQRISGDTRINDLAVWLAPGQDAAAVQQALGELLQSQGNAQSVEMASSAQIRAVSLRIFDRSFAVTYWLQAVAIGIGLFGVAASFSAQVLARRKEFGLLAHLGLTRGQVLAVVAGEGLAWTAVGALAGLLLGLGVSVVLVHVINPQSFRWTMELHIPLLRLLWLALAVMLAGTLTAWLAGRAAADRDAVLAVKEDW
jgi:putative ABC transport system permease protein